MLPIHQVINIHRKMHHSHNKLSGPTFSVRKVKIQESR